MAVSQLHTRTRKINRNPIKKKIKIVTTKLQEQLSREPKYVPHRWRLIPNVMINLLSFLLAGVIVSILVYWLCKFVLTLFYHLN